MEAGVQKRVFYHEQFGTKNGVPAERNIARCLCGIQADFGFEPLAIAVDEVREAIGVSQISAAALTMVL